jgi:hypothetical protein
MIIMQSKLNSTTSSSAVYNVTLLANNLNDCETFILQLQSGNPLLV